MRSLITLLPFCYELDYDMCFQVQMSKQDCGKLTSKMLEITQPPPNTAQPCDSWTEQETNLVVEGAARFLVSVLRQINKEISAICQEDEHVKMRYII